MGPKIYIILAVVFISLALSAAHALSVPSQENLTVEHYENRRRHVRDVESLQNTETESNGDKKTSSVHSLIKQIRERIKMQHFLQHFDAINTNVATPQSTTVDNLDIVRNKRNGPSVHSSRHKRRRRHVKLVYNNNEPPTRSDRVVTQGVLSNVTVDETAVNLNKTEHRMTGNDSNVSVKNVDSRIAVNGSSASVENDLANSHDGLRGVFHEGKVVTSTDVRMCVHKFNNVVRSAPVSSDGSRNEYNDYDGIDYPEEYDNGPILTNMTVPGLGMVSVEYCNKPSDFCYAFWTQGKDGVISVLGQGCWETSDAKQSCSRGECSTEHPSSKASPSTKFCCCSAHLCNARPLSTPHYHDGVLSTEETSSVMPTLESSFRALNYGMTMSVGGACFGGLVLALLIRLLCHFHKRNNKKDTQSTNPELGNVQETGGPGFSCSTTCVDNLKLHDNIGEGRHAKVWRGSLGGTPVAVKALPACRSAMWARERDLYCLPHMNHPNLLAYFGCDTRPTLEGSGEHLLVLQLAPLGSLRQHLISHTLDWDTYTKMALGVAAALAHLHTHIDKDDQYKPCIVHRDVNSSNVLVRADLSCCLADLGLAMALPDSRKKPQHHKIQEAGTLRYLSPEALEGALDLRRCDAALRAVDVYALALVLWELLSRCAPAHRAPGPQPYAPPYHAEVGEHPTLEQMQVVVGRRKARPLFSPRLLNTRGARLAKDTCEDCWDHDAEARLTAVCVVERLSELRNLKPVPSPTINSNDLRPPNPNHDGLCSSHSPSSTEDKNSNILSSAASNLANGNPSTVFDFHSFHNQPLQPHQGRNPCLERNLASAGPGDRLIDKSLKDMPSNSTSSSVNGYGTNDFIRMEQSVSGNNLRNQPQDFSRMEEQPVAGSTVGFRNTNRFANQNSNLINLDPNHDDAVPSDFRMLTRPITPIGYVQNDVSSDTTSGTLANGDTHHPIKQTNIKLENSNNRWSLRKLFDSRMFKRKSINSRPSPLETEVNLVLANGKPINSQNISNGKIKTSIIINDTKAKNNHNNADSLAADRPSTLPGLDPVAGNSGQDYSGAGVNLDAWRNLPNFHDNNTCTLSPPNQTVSTNMMRQNRDDNVVVGFKELPSCSDNRIGGGNQNQVFAVIVPKANYNRNDNQCNTDSSNWKSTNGKVLLNHSMNKESSRKVENRLVKSDEPQSNDSNGSISESNKIKDKSKLTIKRHSCDEKMFVLDNGKLNKIEIDGCNETNRLVIHPKSSQYRNSYSGEFEIGNFGVCINEDSENCDPNMIDYSSNSEDEHMLLLAENGGSKITMRPRFDAKPDTKNKRKSKQNTNLSTEDHSGSLTKMAAGSFTSLCNKYGPKNKYENFENESSEHLLDVDDFGVENSFLAKKMDNSPMSVNNSISSLQDLRRKSAIIDRNDVSIINLVRNGSVLSLCKNEIDDTSFTNADHSRVECNSIDERNIKVSNDDGSSSDDTTLCDDVFLQEKKYPRPLSIKQNLSRQHSLELVSELFSSTGDISRLKDPASRIKTPGDVPASVRRIRSHKRSLSMKSKTKNVTQNRLSLYDDRIMFGNSL